MNFKERLKQALKSPNKFGSGGYIQPAGGGDQIVYGARHSQGGVMRDYNTELEGGGFDSQGNPKAGEVITTVYDNGGNPQEFYMSYKNGVAQDYLAAKERAGGQLNQAQKQEFAKQNESMNPNGSPSGIAANGGYMNYKHGGAHNSDGSKRGFWDNVHARSNRGESPDKSKVSSDTAKRFNLADGGMRKYFMGGMQSMIDPRDQALYGQGVDRRSGYSLADGGKKLYHNGGEGPGHPHGNYTTQVPTDNDNYILNAGVLPDVEIKEKDPRSWLKKNYQKYIAPVGHGLLDGLGFIPAVGELADGVNALWYTAEGNTADALLSTAAMVPFAGWAATTGKWTKNTIKNMDKLTPGGGDMYKRLEYLKEVNPKLAKELKIKNKKQIKNMLKNDPKAAQKIIDDAETGKVFNGSKPTSKGNTSASSNYPEGHPLNSSSSKTSGSSSTSSTSGSSTPSNPVDVKPTIGDKLSTGYNSTKQKMLNLNNSINKTAIGRGYNPFSGWKGMGKTTPPIRTVDNVISTTRSGKVKGLKGGPGNWTGKPISTPMISYTPGAPRTFGQQALNTGKNAWNLGLKTGLYTGTYAGVKGLFGSSDSELLDKDMNYDAVGDGKFSLINGSGTNTNTINNDTIPVTPVEEYNINQPVELEDLGTTDSIPYTAVGDTLNIEGGNWKRLEDNSDGSVNWEQID